MWLLVRKFITDGRRENVLGDSDSDGSRAGLLSGGSTVLSSSNSNEGSGDDGETHLEC